MSDKSPVAPDAPKRRWVKPLLIVSLAFNLIFVGLITSAIWKHRHEDWRVSKYKAFEQSIEQLLTELRNEKRTKAKSVLDRFRNDVLPVTDRKQAAQKRSVRAMLADPYDEKNLVDALADLREIRSSSYAGMHSLAIELVRDMTPHERRRLIEIFRSKRHHRGKWRKREKPPG